MATLLQDLKYGLRMLAKNPGFTAVAVLTLALGIGANTAIFSLLDAVMLKMLPVKNPEQLYVIAHAGQSGVSEGSNYPLFKEIRDQNQVFSDVFAFNANQWKVSVDGPTELVSGQVVTGNYFSALGVKAILGRTLTVDDDRIPKGHPIAVISYRYWERRFARDPQVLGKTITVNLTPFTIIGVTPPEFFGFQVGRSADISVPMAMHPLVGSGSSLDNRSGWWGLPMIGRLKPGVSAQQASADTDVIFGRFLSAPWSSWISQKARQGFFQHIELEPASNGLSELRNRFSRPLKILMAVVGLVLLVACANVANLLLARATVRRKEMAMRFALGASRSRLVRQLLTESVLLAALGGGLGLVFAHWGINLLITFVPQGPIPMVLDLSPDARVLTFCSLMTLLTGILFGLAPALRTSGVDPGPALKDNSQSLGGDRSRLRLGKALIVTQVAISLLLVIGAGLFVRSLENLRHVDAGFDRDHILLFIIDAHGTTYKGARLAALHQELLERVGTLPGVRTASLSGFSPISGGDERRGISVQGFVPQSEDDKGITVNFVGPRYFETMGIPFVLGRDFRVQDAENAPKVAIVTESMARHYFQDQSPLGRRLEIPGSEISGSFEIIGVVKDAKFASLRKEAVRTIYIPYLQVAPKTWMTLALRTQGKPLDMTAAVRRQVQAVGKDVPIVKVRTLAAQVDESLVQERLVASLSSFFGLLALLLAGVGLYGIMAYSVTRRTNEIGIRMALGAQQSDVLWMVLRETLALILIGVAIGIPTAIAATRVASSLISGLLFGLKATDPATISVAAALMVAVALLAGYLPARRAAKVDPMVALRYE